MSTKKNKYIALANAQSQACFITWPTESTQLENNWGDYPPHLVKKVQGETLRVCRDKGSTNGKADSKPVYIALPFVDDELCRKTEGIVKSSRLNVRVAWKGGPNLRRKLVRSAFRPLPCPGGGKHCHCCEAWLDGKCHTQKKNVVYRMDCTVYIMWELSVILCGRDSPLSQTPV